MSTLTLSGWSGSDGRKITLTTSDDSVDITNNKSKVAWTVSVSGGTSTYYSAYVKVTINGVVVYNKTGYYPSMTSFPVSAGSVSGTTDYITHNADGTKSVNVKLEGWIYSYDTKSTSTTMALQTIARASIPTVYTAASGGSLVSSSPVLKTVYIRTNRASTSFTHTITYNVGSLTNQTAGLGSSTGVTTYTTFTPPLELLKQLNINSGDSATLTVTLKTYSGSTIIGTKTTTFTLTGTGYVSIDNGSSFDNYIAFVDNGSSWDRVVPYVDSGSAWNLY